MNNPFPEAPDRTFAHRVEGTSGEFSTLGRDSVSYIMTDARLGTSGTDWERRLTVGCDRYARCLTCLT